MSGWDAMIILSVEYKEQCQLVHFRHHATHWLLTQKNYLYQLQMAGCCKEKFHTFLAEKIGISLNVLIPNSLSKNFEGWSDCTRSLCRKRTEAGLAILIYTLREETNSEDHAKRYMGIFCPILHGQIKRQTFMPAITAKCKIKSSTFKKLKSWFQEFCSSVFLEIPTDKLNFKETRFSSSGLAKQILINESLRFRS